MFVPLAIHGRHSAEQEAYLDKLFLDILDDLTMKGHTVNSKSGSSYAPTAFSNHPLADGVTKTTFKATMKRLKLKNEDYNTAKLQLSDGSEKNRYIIENI